MLGCNVSEFLDHGLMVCHVSCEDGGDHQLPHLLLLVALERREHVAARIRKDGECRRAVVVFEHRGVIVAQRERSARRAQEGVVHARMVDVMTHGRDQQGEGVQRSKGLDGVSSRNALGGCTGGCSG